jgi:small subunit ribosomal protein S4
MRALGLKLPGLSAKSIENRPYPPGEHGQARRRKLSDYALQLREKQKLKLNYGLREKQLRRLLKESKNQRQLPTGDKLIELLERRADNVVFRAGFAATIPQARQLISHGHVMVNGRKMDIASFRVAPGDILSLRTKSQNLDLVVESLAGVYQRPEWMDFDESKRSATVKALPTPEYILFPIEVQLVVEYYTKSL